ncbi:MAG TPA: Hpt domain-containing protein [Planctomycetaceae bacterium]|nr:Hpt domain-containing protein [Planctomycetaceae bacterium]
MAGEAGFREVLEAFLESLPDLRRTLQERFDCGDVAGLRVRAHQLRGSAGGYGFPALTAIAARLEAACEAGAMERIGDDLDGLLAYLERIGT